MLPPALKNYHDAVYCLTVPSAAVRQAEVVRQLGEGNFEFVYGPDKGEMTLDELRDSGVYDEAGAIEADRSGRSIQLGMVCCTLGHRQIYEKFLRTDAERCLVFEDDVVVNRQAITRIDEIVAHVPKDAELIYWGWLTGERSPWYGPAKQAAYHIFHSLGFLKYDHTMIKNLYSRAYNEFFDVAGKHFGGHAYTVTRAAAETLVQMNTPIRYNSDNLLMQAVMRGKVRGYICRTPIFSQRSVDPSDPMPSLTGS